MTDQGLKLSRIILIFVFGSLTLHHAETFLPIDVTSIDVSFQVGVPYSFILPTFRRRRSISDDDGQSNGYEEFSQEEMAFTRLHTLLTKIGVDNPACQKLLLCMVSQNPNKYSPLSEFIFQHLDPRLGHRTFADNNTSTSHLRFIEFYEAGRRGFYPGTNCSHEPVPCPSDPDKVINWDAMQEFQLIKHFINLKLK